MLDTKLYSLKTASKTLIHKTGEFLGNKIADAVTNSYNHKVLKTKPQERRNNYSTRKKRRNIRQIKTSITKSEHYKIPKLLNDSTKL